MTAADDSRDNTSRELLRDFLDNEREEAHEQALWLSVLWVTVTIAFLVLTLIFVLADSNPAWLSNQARALGAPPLLAERLELAAIAPVLANVSGAVFLNFWRMRRRKLRFILAEAMVLDDEYDIARGVLFGSDRKSGKRWKRLVTWARDKRRGDAS